MGWKKKAVIFLLPLVLYGAFKYIKANFLIFVLAFNLLSPRLPFQVYKELNPDINDFATSNDQILEEYDFVVVGAGSAGAVVANRLSENKSWKVLLLEAGGTENILSEIPGVFFNLVPTELNWGFKTQPNEDKLTSTLMQDGRVIWPRGRVLGGSSAVNAMLYTRGNKKDYDLWHKLGNDGWSYENVLHYFKKSEDVKINDLKDTKYHSTDGELTVSQPTEKPKLFDEIIQACKEVLSFNADYNGEKQTGCFHYQYSIRNGQRCSTAKAFLKPKRSNLHVSPLSLVQKINIDPETKRVTGVLYKKGGKLATVAARKEVILSAGVLQSPQVCVEI